MKVSFGQQFKTLFQKHLKNHIRGRNFIKEVIALAVVAGICIGLKYGGGNGLSYLPIYMPLAIMLYCRGSIMTWVSQKQYKHVEVQKIMSASFSAYLWSWMTFFLANGIILSILFIATLAFSGVFEGLNIQDIFKILSLYFLLMLATLSYCMMISSFFSDAQLAAQVVTFVQLIGLGLFYLLKIDTFRESAIGMGVVSLIPSVAFQFTSIVLIPNFSTYVSLPYTIQEGYIFLGAEALGYFLAFMYLEMVLPNQNGANKHPLFFILDLFKSGQQQRDIDEKFELSELTSARFYEDDQEKHQITCHFKNLKKKFGRKTVVNGLGLTLYKKEIFCLLGHNGAGKTTTINMLTGILTPDQGDINIFGYDSKTDLNQIRQKVGVCLQMDVLYDNMSVKEHLQFYGRLKGYRNQDLQGKVEQIMEKCCLVSQQEKLARTLSGGNKRKLCLACAAIGDSELIFLDEPSSGMDPNTRRMIWGMIEQLKEEGRTIVLTTHHLQEAEALSDRIGILANGQLMILGSCRYIKERFGVGYNLTVNLKGQTNSKKVQSTKAQMRDLVKKIVGECRQDDQMAKDEMKFLLPVSKQQHYSVLFQHMQHKNLEFSLTMSSLEDIFVRIGIDPDSILSNEPLPQIEKIVLPEYEPFYNCLTQFKAVFIKKMFTVMRSFSVFVSLMLPTMYISIGAVVAMITDVQSKATGQQKTYISIWVKFFILAYFMTMGYSFNTSSFCGSIVAEREMKFKYVSFVMGMRKMPYWLGTLAFDMILFWLPTIFVFIIISVFPSTQNHLFVQKFLYMFLVFACFSISFLPFTYLWTHAFQKAQTAYRFFPFFILIFFSIAAQMPIIIAPQNVALSYIMPILSPLVGLVNGMVSEQIVSSQIYDCFRQNPQLDMYIPPSLWFTIGVLLGQGLIYMTTTIVLDNVKFRLNDREFLDDDQMKSEKSEDLKKQQKKIKELGNSAPVIVDSLYKKYPNGYLAIKENSFVVEPGETFGLLGPNGAGKSTTFNILTAAEPKTQGKVQLMGTEVNRSVMDIFNEVGVCPQFNPIYDNLTVKQHLIFFARLKGLSGKELQEITDFYITNLQLDEYRNQRSGTLSGGNKRKLCVCIALIGNPSLLFLDQPSAGVDAISRRYLWNILASSAEESKRAIILTTHSIHQAESLCKRIGILIKGEFVCIDTPSQLKRRYGKGYRISARCENIEKLNSVKQHMKENYKDFQTQQQPESLKISFQVPKANFKFSESFKLFYNKLYLNGVVKQYEIAENSLQEVFIYLSKLQPEPETEKFKAPFKFCCWEKNQKGCMCLC